MLDGAGRRRHPRELPIRNVHLEAQTSELGQLFREAVQKEAQELERSQFLQQLNKARASIKGAAIVEGAEYVRTHETHFEVPCSVCGKPMKFSSKESNFEKEVKATLHNAFKNWSHVTCHK